MLCHLPQIMALHWRTQITINTLAMMELLGLIRDSWIIHRFMLVGPIIQLLKWPYLGQQLVAQQPCNSWSMLNGKTKGMSGLPSPPTTQVHLTVPRPLRITIILTISTMQLRLIPYLSSRRVALTKWMMH